MIPHFKPFSEAITVWEAAVLASLAVLAFYCVGVYCYGEYRRIQRRWLAFKEEAVKRGLNTAQTDLLIGVAHAQRLKNPQALLRNLNAFDRYVGGYAAALADRGLDQGAAQLDTITQARQVLGFDRLKVHQSLSTTRQLPVGQRLVLWPQGHTAKTAATCTVMARDDGALVAVPVVKRDEQRAQTWTTGMRLDGRFSGGDRGVYSFSTLVYDRSAEGLVLRHCHGLKRSGGRHFLRWDTQFELGFYGVPNPLWGQREEGLDLTELPYFEALVTNVSGGGLCAEFVEPIPQDTVLVADPDFVGPFPLAGIACRPVAGRASSKGERALHLKFIDLANRQENGIVQAVNRFQLETHPAA